MDFIAIGDTVVDEFIRLKNADVHCDINREHCTITMGWGDKIPYESTTLVPAVGNSANAAVAAARLGLSSGLVSHVGRDQHGDEILAQLSREGVDISNIKIHDGIPTNHYFVLWYESERTILTQHQDFPFSWPSTVGASKWIYLSSAGQRSDGMYDELLAWLVEHPETKLAFQPGTLQIQSGTEKLKGLYIAAEVVACNKDEAQHILKSDEEDMRTLLEKMRSLGPKIALITDGPNGAYVSDGTATLKVPMYPDPKPPIDRTGAGDATSATFAVALALGKPLAEALAWGPVNAMSVVQEIGAQKGLLSRDALEKLVADAPAEYRVTPI